MPKPGKAIKAAAAQLPASTLSQAADALRAIQTAIEHAADQRAELLVLPECAYPSYYIPSVDAFRSARVISNAELMTVLGNAARRHGLHVVCGFVEDRGDALCNAAAVIDDSGSVIGVARKTFLWGDDNKVFSPGCELEVFRSKLGNIGVAICADARAPEVTAGLAWRGAAIVAVPTCWVNLASEPGQFYNPQPDYLIPARTREIRVPFVCANKFGRETDELSYCGYSLITDADGRQVAKASPDEPAMICADIHPKRPRKPDLPDWARDRICSTQPAELYALDQLDRIKIAVVPGPMLIPTDDPDTDPMHALAAEDVQVVGTSFADGDAAAEMTVYARALGIRFLGYAFCDRVLSYEFGACGVVRGKDVLSFATARALVLDGAALLLVTDAPDELPILRARAMENRVYVAAASDRSATLIAPDGTLIAHRGPDNPGPVIATIDLATTLDKHPFRDTHIFDQRKPAVYARAFR